MNEHGRKVVCTGNEKMQKEGRECRWKLGNSRIAMSCSFCEVHGRGLDEADYVRGQSASVRGAAKATPSLYVSSPFAQSGGVKLFVLLRGVPRRHHDGGWLTA